MHHVRIVETTDNVQNCVTLPDISKEFISETFAFAGSLYESGDVDNFNRRGHNPLRHNQFGKLVHSLIGNSDYAYVWLNCTKRKVSRLGFRIGKAVKQGRFPHIRQTDNTAL